MDHLLDLSLYPLNETDGDAYQKLVQRCRAELAVEGMFNLEGLVKREALQQTVDALSPKFENEAFTHKRKHNIYFKKDIPGLASDHPALMEVETVNHTLCADQLDGNPVLEIYKWQPLIRFLGDVMEKSELHTMRDPLAQVNVMAYREGETLNWHFDRSELTTTLLLQAPEKGGEFQYRTDLRSETNPNYEGVAKLLKSEDPLMRSINPEPGTLNVFRGINTPHRVTKIGGARERIIAVFSYYDRPDVVFSPEEQIGFYGRTAD